jgi:hypothetical protein
LFYREEWPMARKPGEIVGVILRFPERMRRRVEKAAKANARSMNAEINDRLTQSFAREELEVQIEAAVDKALKKWRPPVSKAERAGEIAGRKAAQADFTAKPEESDK